MDAPPLEDAPAPGPDGVGGAGARTSPALTPTRPLLARRVRELFRVYPKALVGEADAVHDVRVAARRLRVAIVLLAAKPGGRRARRADRTVRDLARAAGRSRDLDVGAELLIAVAPPVDAGEAALRRSLRGARSRSRALARDALLDLDLARLRRDLRGLVAAAGPGPNDVLGRIASYRRDEEDDLERALQRARTARDPSALHRARRAARRLRYASEIADALRGEESPDPARWRKVQNRLGAIQDRYALAAWLATVETRAARRGQPALGDAARRARLRQIRQAARLSREFHRDPTG